MSRRAWACFFAVAVLWGMPYFFIKVALAEVSPAVVSFARLGIGAVVLLPFAWRLGVLGAAARRWPWILALGALYMAVALTLIPVAEVYVSSSLTAIIIAGVPLVVALLMLPWERPTPVEVAGLAVGYAGVAALVGLDLGGQRSQLLGGLVLLLVTVVYAAGPILIMRRLSDVPPLGYTTLALLVGAVTVAGPALVTWPSRAPSLGVVLSLLGLGVLCTALGFVLYFMLVRDAGPQRATLITYLNPLVAVLLGATVLGERLTLVAAAGMVLILAGSWLATRGRRPRPQAVSQAA